MVPGKTTITFIGKHPERAGFRVSGARKRPIRKEGVWSQGLQFDHEKCLWILPAEKMRTVVPANGDVINDDVQDWHIDDVESGLIESEFKCLCTRARTNA